MVLSVCVCGREIHVSSCAPFPVSLPAIVSTALLCARVCLRVPESGSDAQGGGGTARLDCLHSHPPTRTRTHTQARATRTRHHDDDEQGPEQQGARGREQGHRLPPLPARGRCAPWRTHARARLPCGRCVSVWRGVGEAERRSVRWRRVCVEVVMSAPLSLPLRLSAIARACAAPSVCVCGMCVLLRPGVRSPSRSFFGCDVWPSC